jgi:AraC family transcriptional regulator of adaptative response/methylated-DNA-[protein]-cysteine methyltransferase
VLTVVNEECAMKTVMNDAARWDAIVRRDAAADGAFFYAVKTTGVYCRPSCAARLPHRENVSFYSSPAAARAAGFRPCKRCQPDGPSLTERRASAVALACQRLDDLECAVDVETLAREVGMSRYHFQRVFKEVTGLTPRAYQRARRERAVRTHLSNGTTVTEAIYAAGFNSTGRFYADADRALGMRPVDYRSGGAGTSVRFGVGECSLGAILVATSERGICAILLGTDPEALVHELELAFPRAELQPGGRDFETWMSAVIGLVEAPRVGATLPLDVRGTAFQQRVWHALTEIPAGTTATYAEIAERIDAPRAVRAVAAACAANKLAVAIPCHRVIRKDGSAAGYRWGIERKRALLEREGAVELRP